MREPRFGTDRLDGVIAAFDRLTNHQKAELIISAPDLYFATARLVRFHEIWREHAR